jgi:Cft2 family RNA processing exonuclease
VPAPSLTLLTRANEIGANSYLLELDGVRIVIDAGMHPKEDGAAALPRYEDLPTDSIDAIFLSHSHLDHVGTLPVLMEDQPSARVYMTPPTAALADALLHNSVNVMTSQRTELGIPEYPLFTHRGLDGTMSRFETRDYERSFDVDADGRVRATFYDAGHILGSAGILIEGAGKRVFYTGDIHFEDHALMKGARFPDLEGLDALIVETTRGDSERHPDYRREDEEERFIASITKCLERGGSVLVPVFAMGKTQEVLTMIDENKTSGALRDVPVFIGGLSTKMTVIFDKFADTTRRKRPGFRILKDMDLIAGSRRKRRTIEYQPGCIFALSSGMMTEKTVSNQFARKFIDNPKNALLFVGYADPATPGARIRRAQRGDLIDLDPELSKIRLECDVEVFDFSGHAPRDQILEFIRNTGAARNVLVHGDPAASQWFARQLEQSTILKSGVAQTI